MPCVKVPTIFAPPPRLYSAQIDGTPETPPIHGALCNPSPPAKHRIHPRTQSLSTPSMPHPHSPALDLAPANPPPQPAFPPLPPRIPQPASPPPTARPSASVPPPSARPSASVPPSHRTSLSQRSPLPPHVPQPASSPPTARLSKRSPSLGAPLSKRPPLPPHVPQQAFPLPRRAPPASVQPPGGAGRAQRTHVREDGWAGFAGPGPKDRPKDLT